MKLVESNIYRGPRPNSASDYDNLKMAGIGVVVNLESGFFDLINGTRNYQDKSCATRGIQSVDRPMSNFCPPSAQNLTDAVDLLVSLSKDKLVYVHCKSGVDRTGIVIASYRMLVDRWPYGKAREEWISMGRHPWYFLWDSALKKLESK